MTFLQQLSRQIESLDREIEAPDIRLDIDISQGYRRYAFSALDKAKYSGKSAIYNYLIMVYPGQEAIIVDRQLLLVVISGIFQRYIQATRTNRLKTINQVEVLLRRHAKNNAATTIIESWHEKQPNVILNKLKFDKYIARYKARDLIYLYKKTKGEPKVSDAVERASYTLKDIANEVQIYLSSGTLQIQTIFNIREQSIEVGEINTLDREINTLDLASIGKYIAIQKKIIIYIIQLQQIQIGDVLVKLGQ